MAGAYGIDKLLSDVLRKSGTFAEGEYPVWNAVFSGEACSDVLVYGSSRALFHIDPDIINSELGLSAYNLGINGHTFLLEYYRHDLLKQQGCDPELIIQTLDATTLVKGDDLYNPDQFLPYMLNNDYMKEIAISFKGYSDYDFEIPLLRYFGKKEAFLEFWKLLLFPASNDSLRTKGYRGNKKEWTDDLEDAREQYGSYTAEPDSSLLNLFKRFLDECKEQDQAVILVYTPEYIEGQSFVINREVIMELYREISREYGIPLIDYSGNDISQNIDYFYNTTHLNREGSQLFTRMLCNDILESGIINTGGTAK